MKKLIITAITMACIATSAKAELSVYNIAIKDHKFSPANLEIPAEQKVKLVIDNQDSTAEEFESFDLHREKVVDGNSKIIVFVGPVKVGTYKYFGDFNQKTAQGTITAK